MTLLRWRRTAFLTLFILSAITTASSQQPTPTIPPAFEVVTIKPAAPDDTNWRVEFNPGLLRIENRSLRDLIKFAYNLKSDTQLGNATGWVVSEHFDMQGKEDEALEKALDVGPLEERLILRRQLVRGVLEDRFGLRVHIKTTELPAFVLVTAKDGARIKPANPADGRTFRGLLGPAGKIDARGASMQLLADRLSSAPETSGRVVIDKTGMPGEYDWSLRWTSLTLGATADAAQPDPNAQPDASPNLFTALQEQLGLKLVSQKYPIPTLFIDHVQKPSAN